MPDTDSHDESTRLHEEILILQHERELLQDAVLGRSTPPSRELQDMLTILSEEILIRQMRLEKL